MMIRHEYTNIKSIDLVPLGLPRAIGFSEFGGQVRTSICLPSTKNSGTQRHRH